MPDCMAPRLSVVSVFVQFHEGLSEAPCGLSIFASTARVRLPRVSITAADEGSLTGKVSQVPISRVIIRILPASIVYAFYSSLQPVENSKEVRKLSARLEEPKRRHGKLTRTTRRCPTANCPASAAGATDL